MSRLARCLLLVIVTLVVALPAPALAALPPGFTMENLAPGQTFDVPTGIAFLPDGRLLVCEKAGRVWLVQNGLKSSHPLWQREAEVLDRDDRGLLGIAVDPHYFQNHYIYLLYTVDPDSDGVETNTVTFGRLTRYRVGFTDSSLVDPATRAVLMGATWRDAPPTGSPTHTVGGLRWGTDGSLLLSVGDGAWASLADIGSIYPSLFGPGRADPYEDIGAFRSQYVGSLAGKILRLDPANGHGYPSNPYYDGDVTSKRSRVWAYGLRNPYRFTVRPGTGNPNPAAGNPGTLYIGDVGWDEYEEMNVLRQPGANFGWPCVQGIWPANPYSTMHPAHSGCDSTGTYGNPVAPTLPILTVSHGDPSWSTPPGLVGNCIIGGVFYTGAQYPSTWQGRLFFADYARGWLKALVTNANDQLVQVLDFGDGLQGPVDLATDPLTGDLVYPSIYTGEIRRIRYAGTGGNQPPVPVAGATPTAGPAPLVVSFSSTGSFDPDGDPLVLSWVFGDGATSTQSNPSHTYVTGGIYSAILIADDGRGLQASDTVRIVVGSLGTFPTTPIVDTFDRPNGPVGNGWTGEVSSVAIADSALSGTTATIVAPTVYSSATQEAYYTLRAITPNAPQHNLMLKVQGPTGGEGQIEVAWEMTAGRVMLSTWTPGVGWEDRGGPFPVAFQPGDRFGARAYPNGAVEIFRNGVVIGTGSVAGWPFANLGGRIGISLWGTPQSRIDDFGGGDALLTTNTRPHATILAPADSAFYTTTAVVALAGQGADAEDPPDSLRLRWDVLLHHNNHTHPGLTAFADTVSFLPEDHSDGTPVWYEARLIVTDTGGLADTTSRLLFPDVDLSPAGLGPTPPVIGTLTPAAFHFQLRNLGSVRAPRSHWRIVAAAGGAPVTLAEGDTLAAAGQVVTVSVQVPPLLAAGTYALRAVVDTPGVVVETDETNDAQVVPLTVVDGTTGVGDRPARLALSGAFPNPTNGHAGLMLDLPARARVGLDVMDPMGRLVWSDAARDREAGHWRLDWPGLDRTGRVVGAGLYLIRVSVDGRPLVRRSLIIR